jgi:predicted transcriptional regulator
MEKLLSVADAARELGITPARVRYYIKEERLDASHVGHAYVIRESALKAFAAARRPAGRPKALGTHHEEV